MTWQELASHDLAMYTTTWCPDCRRFKKALAKHGIDVPEVDIDADPAAAKRLEEKTGRAAIPYLEIDGGPWFAAGTRARQAAWMKRCS